MQKQNVNVAPGNQRISFNLDSDRESLKNLAERTQFNPSLDTGSHKYNQNNRYLKTSNDLAHRVLRSNSSSRNHNSYVRMHFCTTTGARDASRVIEYSTI